MNRCFDPRPMPLRNARKPGSRSPGDAPPRIDQHATHPPEPRRAESGDLVHLYLREIGQTPLLTPDEEAELLRRLQGGDNSAREQLIHAHLRLVVKLARGFEGWGLALLDLISEGNLGLMKAVDRFDMDRGVRLASYAVWWIKHRMQRAIVNQARTVRMPAHAHDQLMRVRRAAVALREVLGREASDAELGAEIGLPEHKVSHLRAAAQGPTSLDSTLDDEGRTVAECVPDENVLTPSAALEAKSMARQIDNALARLKPRERWVLEWRFDLKGNGNRTMAELGSELGVTREAVRLIQNRALKKLRRHMAEPGRGQVRLQASPVGNGSTGELESAA